MPGAFATRESGVFCRCACVFAVLAAAPGTIFPAHSSRSVFAFHLSSARIVHADNIGNTTASAHAKAIALAISPTAGWRVDW